MLAFRRGTFTQVPNKLAREAIKALVIASFTDIALVVTHALSIAQFRLYVEFQQVRSFPQISTASRKQRIGGKHEYRARYECSDAVQE